ncbi:MAG: hypothetical protein D6765_01220 [Bacteroidetes bacterium]|nr:MAG: hypothetical protein D6765_01220 [Bacteroidota bacterium]
MNSENFQDFLKDPAQLYRIGYQELKSLVLQYPYSHNLRVLLLWKSLQDQHPEWQRNLELAATYAIDRKYLLQRLQEEQLLEWSPEGFRIPMEVLELKNLDTLEAVLAAAPESESAEKPRPLELTLEDLPDEPEALPSAQEPEEKFEFLEALAAEPPPPSGKEEGEERQPQPPTLEAAQTTPQPEWNWVDVLPDVLAWGALMNTWFAEMEPDSLEIEGDIPLEIVNPEQVQQTSDEKEEPQPLPKTSFGSWLERFEPPHPRLELEQHLKKADEARKRKKKAKKAGKKEDPADALARRSLEEHEDLASETLAALLEKQGHYDRAIAMYERLRLSIPEKSGFFARKIEELRQKR